MSRTAWLVVAVAPLLIGAQVGGYAPQRAVFRASASSVIVDVAVRNGRRAVTSLTSSDFELKDNGIQQEVVAFSRESVPLNVRVLVDASVSMTKRPLGTLYSFRATSIADWSTQAMTEIQRALLGGDRLDLLRFNSSAQRQSSSRPVEPATLVEARNRQGRTALFDAIALALMQPGSSDRREAVIVLTDGRDTASIMDETIQREIAYRSDGTVYMIALGGRVTESPTSIPIWSDGYAGVIDGYVSGTGGRLFSLGPNDAFSSQLAELLDELRTRYTLVFSPRGVSSTGWHRVDVAVKGKKYEVRARRGYWANDGKR